MLLLENILSDANLEAQNPSNPGAGSTATNSNNSSSSSGPNPLASAIPLAQLLSKPGALNALSSLTALGGLTDFLGGIGGNNPPVQTTGVHRSKNYQPRVRSPGGSSSQNEGKVKSERSKFAPY
ncbi:Poly(rC)-binding protein 3 [Homalodisca vitripennis]|nr:Poly(rC)-binding protein 3 [Homalodisca vitripennis]